MAVLDKGRLDGCNALSRVKKADLAVVLSSPQEIGVLQIVAEAHEGAA